VVGTEEHLAQRFTVDDAADLTLGDVLLAVDQVAGVTRFAHHRPESDDPVPCIRFHEL